MELRVLKYFLVVAREENITRAAALLHVTQPTLSRQLMQLEEELGVKLFRRGRYHITLTDDGVLLRRRAQEIVDLAEKTEREFQRQEGELTGEIAVGAGETNSMTDLSLKIAAFRRLHPLVRFNIYSATADDIQDRLEKGLLDLGLLAEPVNIGRYSFLRMPGRDRWGVWVHRDSPLARREGVTPEELLGTPLLLARREEVRKELAGWFGDSFDRLEIAGTFNLILNAPTWCATGWEPPSAFTLAICPTSCALCPSLRRWRRAPSWCGRRIRPSHRRLRPSFKDSGMRSRHFSAYSKSILHCCKLRLKCRYPKGVPAFFFWQERQPDRP